MSAIQAYYQTPAHVITACIAFVVLDVVFVGLRFWTRRKQNEPLRVDDWLMVPATALTIAMSGLTTYGVSEHSIAHHIEVPPDFRGNVLALKTKQLSLTSRIEYGFTLMLPIALGCVKMSFLFFYQRIFAVDRKSAISWVLHGLIAMVFLWTLAFFIGTLFKCGLKFWAMWGTTADLITNCVDTIQMTFGFYVSDFVTDVVIIGIPIPFIWRLELSKPKKYATSAVFLLGGVTIAASLCRLIFIIQAIRSGFDPNGDEVLTVTLYLYWGIVECGVGVFAACLPTISFLFKPLSCQTTLRKTKRFFRHQQVLNNTPTVETQEQKFAEDTSSSSDGGGNVIFGGRAKSSEDPNIDDFESGVSRGSNRINGDPGNIESYTTDSSWRTRVPSLSEERLHPPPMSHHMKDLRATRNG